MRHIFMLMAALLPLPAIANTLVLDGNGRYALVETPVTGFHTVVGAEEADEILRTQRVIGDSPVTGWAEIGQIPPVLAPSAAAIVCHLAHPSSITAATSCILLSCRRP